MAGKNQIAAARETEQSSLEKTAAAGGNFVKQIPN